MAIIVSSGVVSSGRIVSGTTMYIQSGGYATKTTVCSSGLSTTGLMIVSAGGSAGSTTISRGGVMRIAGSAAYASAFENGHILVYSGGIAGTGCSLQLGGMMTVFEGGKASGCVIKGDGSMTVSALGLASNISATGGPAHVYISSGGKIDQLKLTSRAMLYVSSGGTATNVTGEYDVSCCKVSVYKGGVLGNVALNNCILNVSGYVSGGSVYDGTMNIFNGGSAYDLELYGSSYVAPLLYVSSGGVASSIGVNSCRMDVYISGSAMFTYVRNGGELNVCMCGYAGRTTVESGGQMMVISGGSADKTYVKGSGILWVNNGYMTNTSVYGGYMALGLAGNASGTLISSGGRVLVSSGGLDISGTVGSGGLLRVQYQGAASNTVILAGGSCTVEGGSLHNVTVNSGGSVTLNASAAYIVSGRITGSNAEVTVSSGGLADMTVERGAVLKIKAGGSSTETTVKNGGKVYLSGTGNALDGCNTDFYISSGGFMEIVSCFGMVSNVTIFKGGRINIYDSGVLSNVTVSSGGAFHVFGSDSTRAVVRSGVIMAGGTGWVSSGGNANGLHISSGGQLIAYADGRIFGGTVVSSGGELHLSSGASANKIEVVDGGYFYISSGASTTEGENHGLVQLASGGTAVQMQIGSNGHLNIFGGSAVSATIGSGGSVYVSNGFVTNTDIGKTGHLRIDSGAVVSRTTVNLEGICTLAGGRTDSTLVLGSFYINKGSAHLTILCGGKADVFSSGRADWTIISGGAMTVFKDGIADDVNVSSGSLLLSSGGLGSQVKLTAGGEMTVFGGGYADGVTIRSGLATVSSGGVADQVYVSSGGSMNILEGGVVSGFLDISSGAVVSACSGAIIDLFLATPAEPYIQNWNLLQGGADAVYMLTVQADPLKRTSGDYLIANGAADFNNTITIKTTEDTVLDTITVGESKQIDGATYTLAKDADELTLSISDAPIVTKATRGDFGETKGISDILFQNLTDAANPLGAWMDADKTIWVGDLGPAAKSDWTVYGAFDFTGDGVCDIMFRSKLASTQYAVGYYDMGHGREFKTMGWGVTAEWELTDVGDFNGNGTSDILWKNTTNGYLGLWMDGTDQWVALPASTLGTGQSIIGMGDVNNDGCDDILINSNGVLGAWDITGILEGTEGTPIWSSFGITVSSDWETIGCADFDGNGKADIVLWNDNSGYIGTYMNCDGNDFRCVYPSASKSEWGIPGFGDYDGDGSEDVLVRNLESGALGYWDGNDNFAWHEIGCGVDSTWAVIA